MSIEVTYKGSMGNDLTVVNAARVSFGKESEWEYEESDAYSFKQHMKLKDKKLIKYLAKHEHITFWALLCQLSHQGTSLCS